MRRLAVAATGRDETGFMAKGILSWSSAMAVSGLALMLALPVLAYDDATAHPAINECAWRVWWEQTHNQKTPVDMRGYDLGRDDWGKLRPLKGRTVLEPGEWPGNMVEGDAERHLVDWIKDGGRTADAPHHFQSLRHFYDPTRPDERQRYLTDVPEFARIFSQTKGRLRKKLQVTMVNPEMDARHWAVIGTSRIAGQPDNRYAWQRGLEAMQQAFAERDPQKKQERFAFAWRVLGETMHLLADMTVPAHVRDDAHPMPQWLTLGGLRGDPYESEILGDEVMQVFNGLPRGPMGGLTLEDHVDPGLAGIIRGSSDPLTLFHEIAAYTNRNFFSADTVSGHYPGTTTVVQPGNGRLYPAPKLQDCTYEQHGNTGAYYRTLRVGGSGSRKVMVLREGMEKPTLMAWLRGQWHNRRTLETTEECAMSQAQVLLPLAFMGCAQLVDLYVPRVAIELASLDVTAKRLQGTVEHKPYGAYSDRQPMLFSDDGDSVELLINDRVQDRQRYALTIEQGAIQGDLSKLAGLQSTDRVALRVHVGGMPVSSNEIQGKAPAGVWVLTKAEQSSDPDLAQRKGATIGPNSVTVPISSGKAFSTVRDPATNRTTSVPSERTGAITLSWTAPPSRIPGGAAVSLSYSASAKETGQSGPKPPAFGAWGNASISMGAIGPIDPAQLGGGGNPVQFERHALPKAEAAADTGATGQQAVELRIPGKLKMQIGNHSSERELRTNDQFQISLTAQAGTISAARINWHYTYFADPSRAPAPATQPAD